MTIALRLFLFGALVATPVLSAVARIERTVEKTFRVAGAGTLRVETRGGMIRVSPVAGSVVTISARQRIRAGSEREADEILGKLELNFEQAGNDVTASAKYPGRSPGLHFSSWPPVTVDFTVTVPADFAAELRTSGGRIQLGDLTGKVFARTSGGSIQMGKMGATVEAHTSGGSISLDEARGRVELETSGGSITVGRVVGPAVLSTSGGSIRIEAVEGALRAHTSGGSIRAGLLGPLAEDCVLSTSGGGVTATVSKAAAFRLDASTSGGGIEADGLTLTLEGGRVSRNRLSGSVNGGGPLLKLRSSGGNIVVRTQ